MNSAIKNVGAAILALIIGGLLLGGAWGWVWNIVKAFHMLGDPVTGMFIARALGVFIAPLGAILGFM